MRLGARFLRLLDPWGGDIIDHPYRRLRLNLRRVELMGMLALLIAFAEGLFASSRRVEHYLEICVAGGLIAIGFIAAARWGQRHSPHRLARVPEFFIAYALVASLALCFMVALTGRMPWGLALVYLACAIFFLIPPKRFAIIGIVTFILFVIATFVAPLTPFERTDAIFNTTIAIVFGIIGRWGLDRLEKITERQLQQIASQNARLQQQNEELAGLMAIAAHDLRSPLLGLRNLLHLASERPPRTPKAWEELLGAAGGGIESMQHLISRILQAHEVEGGKAVELRPVDVLDALRQVAARHHPTAQRHGLNLRLELPGKNIQALSDSHALGQILDNLVSNAIRFSPEGSAIDLRVEGYDRVVIEVVDHGVGLDGQAHANLFRKFGRGEHKPVNGGWGSGMGLFIVKTLAESIRADVSYMGTPGGGSTFRITLPST